MTTTCSGLHLSALGRALIGRFRLTLGGFLPTWLTPAQPRNSVFLTVSKLG